MVHGEAQENMSLLWHRKIYMWEQSMNRLLRAFRIESRVQARTQNGAQKELMKFEFNEEELQIVTSENNQRKEEAHSYILDFYSFLENKYVNTIITVLMKL